jgi:PhnB protein
MLTIEREFQAPRMKVWRAWTDPNLLDKWWGPRQWPATTKSFEFREGGHWHYFMQGPDGVKSWSLVRYKQIIPEEYISAIDSFCDEAGVVNATLPSLLWETTFEDHAETTRLTTKITFATEQNMQTIIDMGFEAGYTEQLDKLGEFLLIEEHLR